VKIIYTKNFVSQYKKLPPELKSEAEGKEKLFRNNPFDPKLKIHKLTGKLKGRWSFRLDYKNRIVVTFNGKNEAWFIAVGNHDIYKK